MSFYGSVYYQLIDTFHKIVLTNNGKDFKAFATNENMDKDLTQQAIGRKGVITLDTGNRWINFSQAEKDNPNDPDNKIIYYKIWHGEPDKDAINENNGFKLLDLTSEEIAKRVVKEGDDNVIVLADADKFETHEAIFDDAGHIVSTERKVYKLPKAEVNDKVEKLETLVGTPQITVDEVLIDLQLPEVLEKRPENVHTFIESNTKDINLLQTYVGDWSEQNKQPDVYSISEVIGNINTLLGENYLYSLNFRSLSDIIGLVKELNAIEFNSISLDGQPISGAPENIIDGIVKLKNTIDTLNSEVDKNKDIAEDANLGLTALIGKPIDAQIDIYDHLKTIYGVEDGKVSDSLTSLANRTKAIEDDLDWQQNDTVNTEIINLQNRAGALENRATELESRTTSAESRCDLLETRATNLESRATTLENRAGVIEEEARTLKGRVDTHYEQQNAQNATFQQTDAELRKDLTSLSDSIGEVPEDSTVIKEINTINSIIGDLPEGQTTLINYISSIEENLNTTIGEVSTDSSVMNELNTKAKTLQDNIDVVAADLGKKIGEATAFEEISALAAKVGNVTGEKSLFDLISENTSLIATQGTTLGTQGSSIATLTGDVENIKTAYVKVEDANKSYAPLAPLADWTEEKTVASEIASINTIIGDTSAWEEPDNSIALKLNKLEEGLQTVENVTSKIGDNSLIEDTIINLLLEIKADIKNMKITINSLHADNDVIPFPEVIESEGEEEPIE